jgi:diguanylate cyclase (GGDEF)-like protein
MRVCSPARSRENVAIKSTSEPLADRGRSARRRPKSRPPVEQRGWTSDAADEAFRVAADAMSDAVLVIDPHGRIRFRNAAANKRFDPAVAQAAGRDAEDLLKQIEQQALDDQERVRDAIAESAALLVSAASVDAAMPRALEILGEALRVQRVLVVENAPTPDQPRALKFSYGWQSNDAPVVIDGGFFSGPLATSPEVEAWLEPLQRGRPVIASARSAKGAVSQMLKASRSKSILFVPTFVEGQWWGTIGIDDCEIDRHWSPVETSALQIFASVVGGSIIRQRHWIERERAEEELERLSHHDALTGLANRVLFRDALEHAVARAHRGEKAFAVLYLDLDHFKDINDTLGHRTGDLLLQTVGERLVNATRETDMVARFGGDEFAVLVMDVRDPTDVGILASKIIDLISMPFAVEGNEVHISVSVGIAVYEPGGQDAETYLMHAELALYRAKADGRRTYRFFTDSMDVEVRARVTLNDELRRAIADEQFFLVYQPQVDIDSGRIVGVEALVRWRHPEQGVVYPDQFIPTAEKGGLIVPLGRWVLNEACRQTRAWLDAGVPIPLMAVNMSPAQFRAPVELERDIVAVLDQMRLPQGTLQLELTETTLMETSSTHASLLGRLRAMGIKISIDDFGTGYSSLDYLHRYSVDQIKIAQVFVAGIAERPEDVAIVKASIGLAREFGLNVIAEGAETAEQVDLLAGWGCREIQGYYFSRPLTADVVEPFLRQGFIRPGQAASREQVAAR